MLFIALVGIVTGIYTRNNISEMLKDFVLVPHDYWFMEVYLILCVISPMLNKLVESIIKENFAPFNIFFWGILCGYGFITASSFVATNRAIPWYSQRHFILSEELSVIGIIWERITSF